MSRLQRKRKQTTKIKKKGRRPEPDHSEFVQAIDPRHWMRTKRVRVHNISACRQLLISEISTLRAGKYIIEGDDKRSRLLLQQSKQIIFATSQLMAFFRLKAELEEVDQKIDELREMITKQRETADAASENKTQKISKRNVLEFRARPTDESGSPEPSVRENISKRPLDTKQETATEEKASQEKESKPIRVRITKRGNAIKY